MGSEEETGSPSFAEESDTIYLRIESVIKKNLPNYLYLLFRSIPFFSPRLTLQEPFNTIIDIPCFILLILYNPQKKYYPWYIT